MHATTFDSLSRKIYRQNIVKANFQKTRKNPRRCVTDTRATKAKYLGLQNNINRLCKSLNEIDDEIVAILEPENNESHVSESMGIMEPVHEILEIALRLENMRLKDSK